MRRSGQGPATPAAVVGENGLAEAEFNKLAWGKLNAKLAGNPPKASWFTIPPVFRHSHHPPTGEDAVADSNFSSASCQYVATLYTLVNTCASFKDGALVESAAQMLEIFNPRVVMFCSVCADSGQLSCGLGAISAIMLACQPNNSCMSLGA